MRPINVHEYSRIAEVQSLRIVAGEVTG